MNTRMRLFSSLMLATLGMALSAAIPPDYKGKPFQDENHKTSIPNIPGILQCALFDLGGEGVAYHDTTEVNEGSNGLNREIVPYNHQRAHASPYVWHFRANENVDISYVKDWADLNHPNFVDPPIGQFYVGWCSEGEWLNYTVNVTEPGTYAVKCLYTYHEKEITLDAKGQPAGTISFDINHKPAAICKLPKDTKSWHIWDYGQIATITFPEAGPQLLTFHYRRGNNWAFWVFEKISK